MEDDRYYSPQSSNTEGTQPGSYSERPQSGTPGGVSGYTDSYGTVHTPDGGTYSPYDGVREYGAETAPQHYYSRREYREESREPVYRQTASQGYTAPPSGRGPSQGPAPSDNEPPKKKRSLGTIIAVVVGVVLIGAVVTGAAWSINRLMGSNIQESTAAAASAEPTTPAPPTNAPSAAETTPEQKAAETTTAAPAGAQTVTTGAISTASPVSAQIKDVSDVVDGALPSVVSITTTKIYQNYSQYGFNPFDPFGSSEGGTYQSTGAGSGVIIGDDGTWLNIVTNCHVVSDADTTVINFCDGTSANAVVKGTSPDNDIAVVAVKLSDLSDETRAAIRVIEMGDSDSLRLGEGIIVLGNALGLGQSVTTGVLSATDRAVETESGAELAVLQTDAAINPGNSGGAMLNSEGKLVGITVAKSVRTYSEAVGYCIPISDVKDVITQLASSEAVAAETRTPVEDNEYPYLGVQLQTVSASAAQMYNMPAGVMIYSVEAGTPAEQAGLQQGDIITGLNDKAIASADDLSNELQYITAGTEVNLIVQRANNSGQYQEQTIPVTLGARSDFQQKA